MHIKLNFQWDIPDFFTSRPDRCNAYPQNPTIILKYKIHCNKYSESLQKQYMSPTDTPNFKTPVNVCPKYVSKTFGESF